MIEAKQFPKKKFNFSWRNKDGRAVVYQFLSILTLFLVVWVLFRNTLVSMKVRGIQSGYDFLLQPFGFDISEYLIGYSANSSYLLAFTIGLLNTLKVAVVGILLATILGTFLGVGRFSSNWLVRKICYCYVEFFRNIPLYLQLLIWYLLFTATLPDFSVAWKLGNFFLSKNGLSFPWPVWHLGQSLALIGLVLGVVLSYFYAKKASHYFDLTGQQRPVKKVSFGLILGLALAGWLSGGAPNEWNLPIVGELEIENGIALSPEYLSLLIGLVVYTAAFIAEIVRSGISSVSLGQVEAASSLGLSKGQSTNLVILPQALRTIIPPLTSQYLNLTKNSSLAVAIGYPDLVSIANTTLNQTGRAVEALSLVMLVYLSLSLLTSLLMNWFNANAMIKER